ncbi:acetate--CoA ligase family protein [Prauserella cavernicola]|uniref:Acetate--CoA ligase family protein n=1 Tax=Prauserella cavernicola TaxID=2800127 RepID=A0A934QNJ7_9PSEU|nr:acetate--CoA ligase family protein [Prauserella cavernicola]MBK1783495.1 acetate--CoA ligase family protein [Prauserella cavernicola]
MSRPVVAVVGASPRNFWTTCALHNLRTLNPELEVVPVTPNHDTIAGLTTVPSVAALPATPRAAIVAIRREASVEAVRELTAAGTRDIVLVTDGFGERDDEGSRLQDELVRIVSGTGTRLWGPNCVGFADFAERVCAVAEPMWLEARPGPVSIVSQSGALLSAFLAAATEENLGVDFCASTGNGAVLGVPQALEQALRRDTTRVVCVYLEGVSGTQLPAFTRAFTYARQTGKRIVILKSGVSERGQRAVLSHTASIAGTDSVFSELLREHDVLRADGVDELMRLATLCLLGVKKGRERAVSVLGGSGGAAALCSDLAERYGVNLTVFAESTVRRIRELAGPGSFIDNPLDVIGVKRREGEDSINGTVFKDPNTGLVLLPWSVQFPSETAHESIHTWNWNDLARLSAENEMPLVITSMAPVPGTEFVRGYRERHPHVGVLNNLRLTFSALAKLFPALATQNGDARAGTEQRVLSEAASRDLVEAAGVPVVRGVSAPGDELAGAAAELRAPFAVKVIAPISHKSRFGGVALGVTQTAELPATAKQLEANLVAAGLSPEDIEGYLVEEMVFGRELLVGLNTDPVLGRYVVVGLGGTATELANRSLTRRLPLRPGDAEHLLAEVGVSGHAGAVEALTAVCEAFTGAALGEYETVEINPLIVTPTECWAADAVVTRFA